jgi:hypothetical protein
MIAAAPVTCSTAGEASAAPSMLPPDAGSPSATEAAARLTASRLNAVARVTVSCSALADPEFRRANSRTFTQHARLAGIHLAVCSSVYALHSTNSRQTRTGLLTQA